MRTLTVFCFVVLLTACTPPSMNKFNVFRQTESERPGEQRLFIEGINQTFRNQNPQALMQLKNSYPDSQWAEIADAFISQRDLVKHQQQRLDQYQSRLDELSTKEQTTITQDQIDQCLAENKNLQKELDLSNKRLEALRELSIELELKQP